MIFDPQNFSFVFTIDFFLEMDWAHLITAIYHDKPGVIYENPLPPSDYSEDDFESPFFIFPRPQSVKGVDFIKVDRELFPKSLINVGKGEQEASTETVRDDGNIKGQKEGSRVEVLMNQINSLELRIDKSKASLEKKIKQEILQSEEPTVFLDKKKEKRKNGKKKKSSVSKSPVSISKSYSGSDSNSDYNEKRRSKSSSHHKKSNLDSDYNQKRRSKSSSGHKKSHSKKSSRRSSSELSVVKQEILSDSGEILSDDENFSSNFPKKAEISVKEEVLSDGDDYRRKKSKSSKSSKKKYNDARSQDESRNYDDSKKYYESRSRDDSRSRDSWNYEESRHRFDESRNPDDSRNRYASRKNYSDYSSDEDRSRYYDSNSSSKNHKSYMQREMKQEIKQEPVCASYNQGLNDWFCQTCKLQLNSETTYSSHIVGKKHKRMVRNISEQEVAKSSVLEITESKKFFKSPDKDQIELYDKVAKIQKPCEEAADKELLILGLDFVREIRGYEDTKYFCELCSAQCVANTIIKHLVGFKHHKNCMKEYCPRDYRYIKDREKRDSSIEKNMDRSLRDIIRFRGKGRIRVFQEIKQRQRSPEVFNPYQPSTSRQTLLPADVQGKKIDEQKVTDEDCLSRDYSDFYCTVCDSHMNNYSMWESHARGKKHARNKKKGVDGSGAASNYIEAPFGTISHLEELIQEQCSPNDFIVGLKFIRENQGENGDLYNCFLCGSVCPTIDIIDHLYLRKHKTKYLEKMLSDGYHNAISEINSLHIGENSRENLIDEECERLMLEFGRGKPVICIAKKTF